MIISCRLITILSLHQILVTPISYATTTQVEKQEIVRILPINGVAPTDIDSVKVGKYPISRSLFLAAKKITSPVVKQFIEFALSPQGQQIGQNLGFISVK